MRRMELDVSSDSSDSDSEQELASLRVVEVRVAEDPDFGSVTGGAHNLRSSTSRSREAGKDAATAASAAVQSLVQQMEASDAEVLQLEQQNAELGCQNATLKLALAAEKKKVEAMKREKQDCVVQCEAKLEAMVATLARDKARADAMIIDYRARIVTLEAELDRSTGSLADRTVELHTVRREMEDARLCTICFELPRNAILLPCSHGHYCQRCAIQVFNDKKPCPTCRVKLTGFTQYFAS